jgi:hypothetical protein
MARITLNQANIDNHHFYLSTCRNLFPATAIGGGSKEKCGAPVTVCFEPDPTVETDVDGEKIFRNRSAVREFLKSSAASAGDIVIVERVDNARFEVRLESAA